LPFAGAVTCRPPADLGELEIGFARCIGFGLEGSKKTKPSFICIDRIDGQNGVLCPDATAGIAWEEALCQRRQCHATVQFSVA